MVGVRVVADRSKHQAKVFMYAEEDIDASPDCAGYCRLRSEVIDEFPSDHILIVV